MNGKDTMEDCIAVRNCDGLPAKLKIINVNIRSLLKSLRIVYYVRDLSQYFDNLRNTAGLHDVPTSPVGLKNFETHRGVSSYCLWKFLDVFRSCLEILQGKENFENDLWGSALSVFCPVSMT